MDLVALDSDIVMGPQGATPEYLRVLIEPHELLVLDHHQEFARAERFDVVPVPAHVPRKPSM